MDITYKQNEMKVYKKTAADSSKVKNGLAKYCKYCGSEIGSDQIFCFSCGIKAE